MVVLLAVSACSTGFRGVECSCPLDAGPFPVELDGSCIRQIGQALNLQWDSFKAEPTDYDAALDDPASILLGGGFVLASSSGLTNDGWASVELPSLAERMTSKADGTVAQRWFELVSGEVEAIVYAPDDLSDDAVARFVSEERVMVVGELHNKAFFDCDPALERCQDVRSVLASTLLVHETAHGYVNDHVRTTSGGWEDSGTDGAHGVAAYWLYDWLQAYAADYLTMEQCQRLTVGLSWECQHIQPWWDFDIAYEPCDRTRYNPCVELGVK